jgi:Uma2 family endonuclease
MAVHAAPVTANELLRMPDDGNSYELVRGELRVMSKPGFEHGRVAARIGTLLGVHVHEHSLGVTLAAETGFLLERDPDTVRAPDAAFLSEERVEQVGRTTTHWLAGAPDLAVEVISPNDTFREVQEKALEWLHAGTIAVLVLDSAKRTATVYRGQGDAHVHGVEDTLDLSDAVPGFGVAVAELFG